MRKTKEILRQKWVLSRTHRAIAASAGVSAGAVGATLERAQAAGLHAWSDIEQLAEDELERLLYPSVIEKERARPEPDCGWIHTERSRPGVTLDLLHQESWRSSRWVPVHGVLRTIPGVVRQVRISRRRERSDRRDVNARIADVNTQIARV